MLARVASASEQSLLAASRLLAVPRSVLAAALCTRTLNVSGTSIECGRSSAQARASTDGLAKRIYGLLFAWLVTRINGRIAAEAGLEGAECAAPSGARASRADASGVPPLAAVAPSPTGLVRLSKTLVRTLSGGRRSRSKRALALAGSPITPMAPATDPVAPHPRPPTAPVSTPDASPPEARGAECSAPEGEEGEAGGAARHETTLSLLDLFGFESFEVNSFEQVWNRPPSSAPPPQPHPPHTHKHTHTHLSHFSPCHCATPPDSLRSAPAALHQLR